MIQKESTEKFKNIQSQKNEDKHHPGLTIVHLRYMAKIVDGKWRVVVKVPNDNHPASPPEAHLMHWILTLLPVAQFAEVRNSIMFQGKERPMVHPRILRMGALLDLNWLKI